MLVKSTYLQKLLGIVIVISLLLTLEVTNVFAGNFEDAMNKFRENYEKRLGEAKGIVENNKNGIKKQFIVKSVKLRGKGNYPSVLYHGYNTNNVIVLVHGLTDSPYYMEAIAKRFYAAGANVVLPLLPAHGLKYPDKAMEDDNLSEKWKNEVGIAVDIAGMIGKRVSVGGLSTGGALSVNLALQEPEKINGGLFLFSAALNVGTINEWLGISKMFVPWVAKKKDGDYKGIGPNPYKYPVFTNFGGYQLAQIINENDSLSEKDRLYHPIFAAHSIHDTAALIEGIVELFKHHGGNRNVLVIAEKPPVEHASVVLEDNITLINIKAEKGTGKTIKANPRFKGMMDIAISFFNEYIKP
ncbi:MAG: hypothetical protein GY795_38605 [Desulfobacterales bacterium]|nr:hypothetical protein [Desulfobacterales bacterium]